jgi:hypothetical protein
VSFDLFEDLRVQRMLVDPGRYGGRCEELGSI